MAPTEEKIQADVIATDTSKGSGSSDANVGHHGTVAAFDIPGDLAAEAYDGVERIERVTMSWSRTSLIIVYVILWSCYLLLAFQSAFVQSMGPYIVSLFGEHSLLATVNLVSNIASAAIYMPMAKVLDKYGRPQALSIAVTFCVLGLILIAACENIYTYAAGVVFVTIGFSGLSYAVDVITADTSMLKSRGLAYAVTSSPYIITAFAGPAASQQLFSPGINWRWGWGALAIVLPCVVAPFYVILWNEDRKVRATSAEEHVKTNRTVVQSVLAFLIEFDILGLISFTAGLAMFLLPFSLAQSAPDGWSTGYVIAMLVVGFFLLIAFVIIERYVPVPFANWRVLTTGTLLIVCIVNSVFSIAINTWNSYFTSYLQVVYGMSISYAGYINNISNLTSGIWSILIGLAIRYTGRYKWLLLISTPMYALFMGLLIYFRRPETNIGLVIMCEIFLAFASSTIILCVEVGAVAAVTHADVAVAIGLLCATGYIGNALGDTISGAVWTNTLPAELLKRLPDAYKGQADAIYGSLDMQLSFPVGTPVRDAIIESYAIAQTWMLVAGVIATGFMCVLVLFIKDIKLSSVQQTKGRLF